MKIPYEHISNQAVKNVIQHYLSLARSLVTDLM